MDKQKEMTGSQTAKLWFWYNNSVLLSLVHMFGVMWDACMKLSPFYVIEA